MPVISVLLGIVGAILLYLLLWPVPIKPVKWAPPQAPRLEGEFSVNQILAQMERLPVGGLGPEDVIFDGLAGRPFLRKMIYRLPDALKPAPDQHGFVLGLNHDGEVVHNLQDSSGSFAETSGAIEHEGVFYIGSLSGDVIGCLPVPAAKE